MKKVPSEFSNSAWDFFLSAKKIAHNNYQQNVESDSLFLALIRQDKLTKRILEKNNVNIKDTEREIVTSLNSKSKMKKKQDQFFIGDGLHKTFLKANDLKITLNEVVISTDHLVYGLTYDAIYGPLILKQKGIPKFLDNIN